MFSTFFVSGCMYSSYNCNYVYDGNSTSCEDKKMWQEILAYADRIYMHTIKKAVSHLLKSP